MNYLGTLKIQGRKVLGRNYRSVRNWSKRLRALTHAPFSRVYYVVESEGWSIHWDGAYISHYTNQLTTTHCEPVLDYEWITRQIVHFGSRDVYFQGGYQRVHSSNRKVLTWFHGGSSDPGMQPMIRRIPECVPHLDRVVTSSSIGRDNLLSWGVPESKLTLIPLGIDLKRFQPASESEKTSIRQRLSIPSNAICIGSFQKDGVGWGSGLEPKLVKGPDIFLKAIEKLSARNQVFVLLTGPSRGYVRKGLDELGVPYHHSYLDDYHDIVQFFHCLDLYLVTSRDEGGPKAILECMATGVPIVSTRVGMALDVIKPRENGLLVEIEDADGIADAAQDFIDDPDLRRTCLENGLSTAQAYDWSTIAMRYHEEVYRPLLADQGP